MKIHERPQIAPLPKKNAADEAQANQHPHHHMPGKNGFIVTPTPMPTPMPTPAPAAVKDA